MQTTDPVNLAMRLISPARLSSTSIESSLTGEFSVATESVQPSQSIRCPLSNLALRKRSPASHPPAVDEIQSNQSLVGRVMKHPLQGRTSRTVHCDGSSNFQLKPDDRNKAAMSSGSQSPYFKFHIPSSNEATWGPAIPTLLDVDGVHNKIARMSQETETLNCRSGQSYYSLRALKTVPNYCINWPIITNQSDVRNPRGTVLESRGLEGSLVEDRNLNSVLQIEKEMSFINKLPNEILCMIFSYLSQVDLIRICSKVCHRWHGVARSPMLWQSLSFCNQDTSLDLVCGLIRFSPMLKSITIKDRNDLNKILPVLQQNCSHLESINLVRCRPCSIAQKTLQAKALHPFLRRAQLHSLNLKGTDYKSRKFFQILRTLPNLKKLDISCSRSVSPQILNEIAKNTNLKVFKNKWNSDICPKSMQIQLPGKIDDWARVYKLLFKNAGESLTTLEFYAAGIGDSALAELALCKRLRKLCVYNANCFSSESMAAVSSLPDLKELLLHNAKLSTADIASAFQKDTLAGLQCLHLNDSIHLASEEITADSCVTLIAKNCPKLQHLSVTKCKGLTDLGVESILSHCRALISLDISGCHEISGQSLLSTSSLPHHLKLLVVDQNFSEAYDAVKALFVSRGGVVSNVSTWKQRTTSQLL